MAKFTNYTKVKKNNGRVVSKKHMHIFRLWKKTCAKFQKDSYKIVCGVELTRYPLSNYIEGEKMTKFTMRQK